jgi:hypothetical protein
LSRKKDLTPIAAAKQAGDLFFGKKLAGRFVLHEICLISYYVRRNLTFMKIDRPQKLRPNIC